MVYSLKTVSLSRLSSLQRAAEALSVNAQTLRDAGIANIIAFGSVARGEDRVDSDIDLLIVPKSGVTVGGLQLCQWEYILEGIVGRSVDAVIDKYLKDSVRKSIRTEGVEVFHA